MLLNAKIKELRINIRKYFQDITVVRINTFAFPNITELTLSQIILVCAITVGSFLRLWQINAMGYNTDEAVYAGQAAAIAGVPVLKDIFPVFRAHPLLFQFMLSLVYRIQFSDLLGRLLAVAFGIGTVYLIFQIGKYLYGDIPGAIAAALLAAMPYHVVVSRQVLLDGPMVFFSTLTIYLLARFGNTEKVKWLFAAGTAMGLTVLSKETGIILLGSIYTFLALAPEIKVRIRDLIITSLLFGLVLAPFPISLMAAGGSSTGKNYLVWQLFRRPNHEWSFYLQVVPPSVGIIVIIVAVLGLALLRHERSWREKLLLSWVIVPIAFFQLWPVKGFQYLLPIAPPIALFAGRFLGKLITKAQKFKFAGTLNRFMISWLVIAYIFCSLGFNSWQRIQPETSSHFLAGTGGVPGGREAGIWVLENVPASARFMTIGPSMANIIQFYGERKAYGLAVSSNPLHRNPSYVPIINPDAQIRSAELQYLVWDSFSASRSTFFSDKLLGYVNKYNGRAVHTESITVTDANGNEVLQPVLIIYEVHP